MTRIAPISKSIGVLENGTNFLGGVFLRWLRSVESRLNSAIVTDVNGNIAYGGAVIPDNLNNVDFTQYFYEGGGVLAVNKLTGDTLICSNAYITNLAGVWRAINTGYSSLMYVGSLGLLEERISTTNIVTTGSGGDTVLWKKVRRISRVAEGSANPYDLQISAGATVVAQL